MERRVERSQPVDRLASVASFGVSRGDTMSFSERRADLYGIGSTLSRALSSATMAGAGLDADQMRRAVRVRVLEGGDIFEAVPRNDPVVGVGGGGSADQDTNGANEVFSFIRTSNSSSGTVNILPILKWIKDTKRWMGNETIGDVQFGYEVTSSSGARSCSALSVSTVYDGPVRWVRARR